MKKIYIAFIAVLISAGLMAQIKFDPHFDTDWTVDNTIQVPASPIMHQVLFIGGYHEVVALDADGNPVVGVSKENNDFIGITPDGDDYLISVNHEMTTIDDIGGDGGGMTAFKVSVDPDADTLIVVDQTLADGRSGKFFCVDFVHTVGETWTNCGGIISPNGEIWTAEEYPTGGNEGIAGFIRDIYNFEIGTGTVYYASADVPAFEGETIKRYQNIGYMVRIDPENGKAVMKQYNWGRMSFEGGVLMPDNKTVYLFEDGTPGLLTKFVATTPGDFTDGKLYVYKHDLNDPVDGNWLFIEETLENMLNLAAISWPQGATMFNRLEWGSEIGGKVYIAETGRDDAGDKWDDEYADGGIIMPYHYDRATAQGTVAHDPAYHDRYGRILVYDPSTDAVTVYLEGGPEFNTEQSQAIADYPAKHISNVDGLGKVNIQGTDYLIMCEDLNGNTYNRVPMEANSKMCEMYLLDVSIAEPVVDDAIRVAVGPYGAELTGGMGLPDGKSILVNVQHPGSNPNGSIFPYDSDYGVTVGLTGWHNLASITDAEIPVDWINDKDFQRSANLQYQILYVGGHHEYEYLDRAGDPAGSIVSKENNDFIGFTADLSGAEYGWVTINHERQDYDPWGGSGGGMATFLIDRDPATDSIVVVETTLPDGRSGKYFCVDFINTVGETHNNCGGIIGPNGEIWTAEEYPPSSNAAIAGHFQDTADWVIGQGPGAYMDLPNSAMFQGEVIARYQNQGWMVKIDPATGKAIQKQYNWGRMSYEGGVVMPDNQTVYNFEDGTPGMLTKFVADAPGDFNNGKLYVFKEDASGPNGHWIEMDNTNLDVMVNLAHNAWTQQATMFNRLEWGTEIGGKVYIAETGRDDVGNKWDDEYADYGSKPAAHHYVRATAQGTVAHDPSYYDRYGRILEYDPETDAITVYLEGGPVYDTEESQPIADYPAIHLSNTDGLGKTSIHGKDYMLLCEDLNGYTYNRVPQGHPSKQCELYMLDMSIDNPTIDDLTRIMVGPFGAEITGAVGLNDNTILVNLQHPGTHPTTPTFPYLGDYGVTLALHGFAKDPESVNEIQNEENIFQIYPNPAFRTLKMNNHYDVSIYDATGNLVLTKAKTNTVNISNLKPGVYFIRNEKGQTNKLIIE